MVKKLAIIGFLVAVLIMVHAGTVAAAKPVYKHQVSGGGTNVGQEGEIRTVAFTAIQINEDGDAKGQLVVINREQEVELHCRILYLKVKGNQAWIGGVVTQSSDPISRPVGWEFVLRVEDNGNSANDAVDRTSYISFGFSLEVLKRFDINLDMFDWLNGNIQVK